MVLSVTLLIVDLSQFCVCCIRSGPYCDQYKIRTDQDCVCSTWTVCALCGLHAVPWSHIGILMRRLPREPRSTTGLLFSYLCPSGTILLTPYSMVWDWRVLRAGKMLFYWPKLLYPYYSIYYFSLAYHYLSALHCRSLLIIITYS